MQTVLQFSACWYHCYFPIVTNKSEILPIHRKKMLCSEKSKVNRENECTLHFQNPRLHSINNICRLDWITPTLMASTESYLSSLLIWLVMLVLSGAAEIGWMTVASWDCCWYLWQYVYTSKVTKQPSMELLRPTAIMWNTLKSGKRSKMPNG